jgi:uncharacterized membrane protein YedE/YeeE
VVAVLRVVGHATGFARSLEGPKPVALGSQVVGGALLGVGMFVCGTAPALVLAQVGSLMREAWFTLPGVVAGSALYCVVSRGSSRALVLPLPDMSSVSSGSATIDSSISGVRLLTGAIVSRGQNLAESLGVPFWTTSVAMSSAVWAALIYVESAYPWVHAVDDEDLLTFEVAPITSRLRMRLKTWPADIAGAGIGLLQIPCLALTGSGLALSAIYVGAASAIIAAARVPAAAIADAADAAIQARLALVSSSAASSSLSLSSSSSSPSAELGHRILGAVATVARRASLLRTPESWRSFPTAANIFDISISLGIVAGAGYSSWRSGSLARRIAKYRRVLPQQQQLQQQQQQQARLPRTRARRDRHDGRGDSTSSVGTSRGGNDNDDDDDDDDALGVAQLCHSTSSDNGGIRTSIGASINGGTNSPLPMSANYNNNDSGAEQQQVGTMRPPSPASISAWTSAWTAPSSTHAAAAAAATAAAAAAATPPPPSGCDVPEMRGELLEPVAMPSMMGASADITFSDAGTPILPVRSTTSGSSISAGSSTLSSSASSSSSSGWSRSIHSSATLIPAAAAAAAAENGRTPPHEHEVPVVQAAEGFVRDAAGASETTERRRFSYGLGFTRGERAWLFVGGMMLGFGTLLADGGISSHGITGVAQMGLGAMVTTTSMSLAGMVAARVAPYIPGQESLKYRRESTVVDW